MPPALADSNKGVTGSTVINASKQKVWSVMTTMGNFDDKLRSHDGNEAIVEQRFKSLPLLAAIVIVVKAKVTPTDRIEFNMIECDRLKAFSGVYNLSEVNPEKTKVNFNLFVDTGLPVPRFLVNKFIEGKVRSRLKKIKNLAERA